MLLVPPLDSLDLSAREAAALRAYRKGTFFGAVSSIATNETGEVVAPFDHSGFRFRHLALVRGANGEAKALRIAVGGQEASRRPNVQIRVVTERGVSAVIDASEGEWILPQDASGRATPAFLRVEAIAYPDTHANGQRLSADQVRSMKIVDIARLHDRQSSADPRFTEIPPNSAPPCRGRPHFFPADAAGLKAVRQRNRTGVIPRSDCIQS